MNATVKRQKTAKKLLKEKQVQEKKTGTKQVKTKPKKEKKVAKQSYLDKLKLKYQDLKIQNAKKKDAETKIKTVEETQQYKYLIESDDGDSVSVNKYIQSKPRYNSRNYTPKYENDVNDIQVIIK